MMRKMQLLCEPHKYEPKHLIKIINIYKMTNFKAIAGSNNRVIVKKITTEKTASGIIVPSDEKERIQKAEVIQVSEQDEKGISSTIKIGDIILYDRQDVFDININGEKYYYMRESNVIIVLS